jgi:hypothetical protein
MEMENRKPEKGKDEDSNLVNKAKLFPHGLRSSRKKPKVIVTLSHYHIITLSHCHIVISILHRQHISLIKALKSTWLKPELSCSSIKTP